MEMQHEHDAVPRLGPGDARFPFLPGGRNESSSHTTIVTFDDPGSPFDAMGNHDHSVDHPASMNSGTDPGYLAHEQEFRDSGFLTDPDQPGTTVTAEDIQIGLKL